jgi:hypothetical protein
VDLCLHFSVCLRGVLPSHRDNSLLNMRLLTIMYLCQLE